MEGKEKVDGRLLKKPLVWKKTFVAFYIYYNIIVNSVMVQLLLHHIVISNILYILH